MKRVEEALETGSSKQQWRLPRLLGALLRFTYVAEAGIICCDFPVSHTLRFPGKGLLIFNTCNSTNGCIKSF